MTEQIVIHLTPQELSSLINQSVSDAVSKLLLPKNPIKVDELFDRKQAADFLQLSLPTLSKYIAKGEIPCYRVGENLRFKKSDLIECLKPIRVKHKRSSDIFDSS